MKAMFLIRSGQNEQSLQRTFHRFFLPNFGSFDHTVSEKIFFQIDQSETRISMFVNGSGRNEQSLQRTCHSRLLPSFGSFGQVVSEKILKKLTHQKQELLVTAMFVNGSEINEHSFQRTFHRCFLPSFGSFGKVVSEEKIFLEIDQSETRIACGGHVC